MKKYAKIMLILKSSADTLYLTDDDIETVEECLDFVMFEYLNILTLDPAMDIRLLTSRLDRTIDSFSISDCPILFRFQQNHLKLLLDSLNFPLSIALDNRSRMSGEEVLLRGLYELVSGDNKHTIAVTVFGRDWTQQGRAFTWFIAFMYNNHKHLVADNLSWWFRNGFFEISRQAIFAKMQSVQPGLTEDIFNISHFIDCNCLSCSTPGGGPAAEGVDAPRHDDLIQRCSYNGWKSIHGLKHQTVDNALGMTVDMYGPTMLRRNDLALLRLSNVNNRFRILQILQRIQYIIFGDSAYIRQSHIMSYFAAADLPNLSRLLNYAIKTTRMSIEWNYGYTASLFKYFLKFDKLRLMESSTASEVYTVGTLLRNFSIALYGGQTSNYFNISVKEPEMFLRAYISSLDVNASDVVQF